MPGTCELGPVLRRRRRGHVQGSTWCMRDGRSHQACTQGGLGLAEGIAQPLRVRAFATSGSFTGASRGGVYARLRSLHTGAPLRTCMALRSLHVPHATLRSLHPSHHIQAASGVERL